MIGAHIGNYRVVTELGAGAMGEVYFAEHAVMGRRAAIKVIRAELSSNAEMVERFVNEARLVNRIGHPNIVEITDFGQVDSRYYIIMELLAGETLEERLEDVQLLPEALTRRIAGQIAAALEAAHGLGVIHRDLKPENVYLLERGGVPDFVKVLDFGIAKLTGDTKPASGTVPGTLLGTPHYMSPEQCHGSEGVDQRSDIYSLGVVMYRMLTGKLPFESDSLMGLLYAQANTPARPPREVCSDITPEMQSIIMTALEKRAEDRFQDMASFRRALDSSPVTAAGPARARESSGHDEHAREQPARDDAAANQHAREQPRRDDAAANQHAHEQPARDDAAANQQAREQPARDDAAANQQAREQPARENAAAKQQAREQPACDDAAAKQQAREQPARENAAAKQQAREQPARDGATAKQQAREQPARDGATAKQQAREQPARKHARAAATESASEPDPAELGFGATHVRPNQATPPLSAAADQAAGSSPQQAATPAQSPADPNQGQRVGNRLARILVERIHKNTLVLPIMPATARECLSLLQDADGGLTSVAALIGRDPVIAPQIVRHARSALLDGHAPTRSIEQAVSRLGARPLRTILVDLSARPLFESKNPAIRRATRGLWEHSVAVAVVARSIAQRRRDVDPDAAYLAGLLHDVGKPVAAALLLDVEHSVAKQSPDWLGKDAWLDVIRECHREVGVALARSWGLQDEIVLAIARSERYSVEGAGSAASVVCLANALVKREGIYTGDVDHIIVEALIREGLTLFKIEPQMLATLLGELRDQTRAAAGRA